MMLVRSPAATLRAIAAASASGCVIERPSHAARPSAASVQPAPSAIIGARAPCRPAASIASMISRSRAKQAPSRVLMLSFAGFIVTFRSGVGDDDTAQFARAFDEIGSIGDPRGGSA